MIRSETLQVSGVRCERCVGRLASALRGQEGLVEASANLVGEVSLAWDDELTSRQQLVDALARAGFRELEGSGARQE
ncbi:MAG TPA: cation transporter [Gaiellaceae bacterium]